MPKILCKESLYGILIVERKMFGGIVRLERYDIICVVGFNKKEIIN
jgi:hypothetical protein